MASRRDRLAGFFQKTGITTLLERAPHRSALLVLNYHRIGDIATCPFDRGVFSASAQQFDEQVGFLKKSRFQIATLEEAQFLAENPGKIRHFHVLVTLDDGYIDNYTLAFPILKGHGVQGVFFLPTSFVGTLRVPWWDHIAWLTRNSRNAILQMRYPSLRSYDLSAETQETVIGQLLQLFKSRETTNTEKFLEALQEACGLSSVVPNERLFMTMAEAREMLSNGMAIGSHAHSHELLGKQSATQQLDELRTSKAILSSALGTPVDALAYPVGSRSSFSEDTYSAMRDAGYRTGFSFYGGVNSPQTINPLNVLRVAVESEMKFSFFRMQTAVAAVSARTIF